MSIRTYFENIAEAIKEKNPDVTTVTPAQMPQAILDIISEGGILTGTDVPTSDIGNDGQYYIQYHMQMELISAIPPQSNYDNVIYDNDWPGDNGQAYKLFDNNTGTYWSTQLQQNTNKYCGFHFSQPIKAVRVGIYPRAWSNVVQIHNFKIQASNNNSDWVDLYTGEIGNSTSNVKWNYFDFDNDSAYSYYRLFVIDANTSQTITVFEMQLYYEGGIPILTVDNIYYKSNGAWEVQT